MQMYMCKFMYNAMAIVWGSAHIQGLWVSIQTFLVLVLVFNNNYSENLKNQRGLLLWKNTQKDLGSRFDPTIFVVGVQFQ